MTDPLFDACTPATDRANDLEVARLEYRRQQGLVLASRAITSLAAALKAVTDDYERICWMSGTTQAQAILKQARAALQEYAP